LQNVCNRPVSGLIHRLIVSRDNLRVSYRVLMIVLLV
jgi:hypothetical protein